MRGTTINVCVERGVTRHGDTEGDTDRISSAPGSGDNAETAKTLTTGTR